MNTDQKKTEQHERKENKAKKNPKTEEKGHSRKRAHRTGKGSHEEAPKNNRLSQHDIKRDPIDREEDLGQRNGAFTKGRSVGTFFP